VIPEPQKTYLLELLAALGRAANDFVVVGGQALKFHVSGSRATRDFDFILNVESLRDQPLRLIRVIEELGYSVVESSQNFQFEKPIPNSQERMRIDFMAPSEFRRRGDFRVDVQENLHARSCTGGSIAIAESDPYTLAGHLPNGQPYSATIRVTRPHSLIMMKMLALDDRHQNIRGVKESHHDRQEAGVHAADIVAIVSAQAGVSGLRDRFEGQFRSDPVLGVQVLSIANRYFREDISPGFLVYEEFVRANMTIGTFTRKEFQSEIQRAHGFMLDLLPTQRFYDFVAAIDACTNMDLASRLVLKFLDSLEEHAIHVQDPRALDFLPTECFQTVEGRGEKNDSRVREELRILSDNQKHILQVHMKSCVAKLSASGELEKYRVALSGSSGSSPV